MGENLESMSQKKSGLWKWIAISAIAILAVTQIYYIGLNSERSENNPTNQKVLSNQSEALSKSGIELPIKWNDIGKKMIDAGVIDKVAFESLYESRGGFNPEEQELLSGMVSGKIMMTEQNAAYWLNLLWAFGLANKNPILEKGPMTNLEYGGAGNFASTGGWTLAKGNPMDHYSKYDLVELTSEEQALVERVSKNIYRPCCGNSTYFPDCNHGMAMLGLLELMAASGASESEMYKVALQVNSYWFSDTYSVIDQYFKMNGKSLATADPKEILGINYSSAQGYSRILSQFQNPEKKSSGGGCGV